MWTKEKGGLMKGTESGKDKVKKICDVLRRETIEPAQVEAGRIVDEAKEHAIEVIEAAKKEADRLLEEAKKQIQREKNVFESSLSQACKQALEALKQGIEEKLFSQELFRLISKGVQNPNVIEQLITAVVKAIDKEGMGADLSVYVPASVSARSINAALGEEILKVLKEKTVLVAPNGGIEVKLHKQNLTVDISDAALKELVAGYIRKDFRSLIFAV